MENPQDPGKADPNLITAPDQGDGSINDIELSFYSLDYLSKLTHEIRKKSIKTQLEMKPQKIVRKMR